MTYREVESIASEKGYGKVYFEYRTALNTGKEFEVGYVYIDHKKRLFCKCQSNSDDFYLCNEFGP